MKPSSSPFPKATPVEKLIVFLFLSIIMGVILSCIFETLVLRGFLVPWEIVATVPGNIKEIIDGTPERATIRTTENDILSCSLGNNDECWIPDVVEVSYYTKACKPSHVAFYPILKPPKKSVACLEISTGGGYHYDVIYVADEDGQLWRWAYVRWFSESSDIIIMVMLGAFGGFVLGPILWVVIKLYKSWKAPREKFRFTAGESTLLVLSWLIMFSCVLLWYQTIYRRNQPDEIWISAHETERAGTRAVEQTETAEKFLNRIIPAATGPKYVFSEHTCDAEWATGGDEIPCYANSDGSEPGIHTLNLTSIHGRDVDFNAIRVQIGPSGHVFGDFPAITITKGDHLKAAVSCYGTAPDWEVNFDIYLRFQTGTSVHLGTWKPGEGNPIQEIDIDLTKFAGKLVRLSLITSSDHNEGMQEGVWIDPRIEH